GPVQRIGPRQVGGARSMQSEHGLLKEIVGLRPHRHQAQAEPVQARSHQSVELFEDTVLPPRIALHELVQLTEAYLHAEPPVGSVPRQPTEPLWPTPSTP